MELNITKFFNECAPIDYSASVAEMGVNAGADTWREACDDSADYMLLDTDDKRDAFRCFVKSSGGWDESEIKAWSDIELNALLLQWIAGDIRECLDLDVDDVWVHYAQMAEQGCVPSRLFKTDDCRIYFDISE